MIWRELFGASPAGMDRIRDHLLDMLDMDRQTFDLASIRLLSGQDVDGVRSDVISSDDQVNQLVQQVRRELVVHASAHGALSEIPVLLLYMSLVKDLERIGDHAKNLLDVALAGGDLSGDADDRDDLDAYREQVSQLIGDVRGIFASQDGDEATRVLTHWGLISRELDTLVDALVTTEAPARHAVPRALYYLYLKRIVAHLMNVLTALVMPLDKVDFWQEQGSPET